MIKTVFSCFWIRYSSLSLKISDPVGLFGLQIKTVSASAAMRDILSIFTLNISDASAKQCLNKAPCIREASL